MKNFTIKIYSLAGALVRVVPSTLIMSSLSWSEQVDGGQGELRLKLNLPFASSNLAYNQIVRVYESDEVFSPSPRLVYTGIIGTLKRVIDKGEYIEARVLGLASMLSWLYYTSGGAYAFSKSQAQELTMKDIIDVFSVKYPGLITYTGSSVEATGSTANTAFSYEKQLDCLKKIAGTLPWWWTIDGSGVLQFHPNTGGATPTNHYLTIGKNIDSLEVEEKTENIVNKYILAYNGGTYTSQDATSQTANGLREGYLSDTKISDLATATTKADTYIAQNKNYKNRITLTVNSTYNIESIHPGNLITVRNASLPITALKVIKTDYSVDIVKIELEESLSFANQILGS